MSTPVLPHFKPLGLGEVLDQAIRLYRKNFFKFIGIIAVVQIPLGILQLISSVAALGGISDLATQPTTNSYEVGDILGPGYFAGVGSSLVLAIIGFVLVQGVATAALTKAISDSYLGVSNSIFEAYQKIRHRWGGLLIALFLLFLLTIALALWTLIPCIGWLTGPGLIAFLSIGIGQLIAPVVVTEKIGGSDAIRRAWDLARRRFWWVVGFFILLFLFGQLIITGPSLLVTYLAQFLFDLSTDPTSADLVIRTAIQTSINLLLGLIYLPLQLSAMTLFYFDLRVRTEGFDIAMLTYQGADEIPNLETFTSETTAIQSTKLITSAEVGNFVLLSIGVGVLYALVFGCLFVINMATMGAGGLP